MYSIVSGRDNGERRGGGRQGVLGGSPRRGSRGNMSRSMDVSSHFEYRENRSREIGG